MDLRYLQTPIRQSLNYFDILIFIIVVFAAFRGFRKGLIIEVASLLALLLGIYGAIHLSDFVASFLGENWQIDSNYLPMLSFVVTFFIIIFAVFLLGKMLEGFINLIALGLVNKLLGLLFGLVKATLIMSIIVFVYDFTDQGYWILSQKTRSESTLYYPLRNTAKKLVSFSSNGNFQEVIDDIKKEGQEIIDI